MPFNLTREYIEQLKSVIESEDNIAASNMIKDLHPADIAEVFGGISKMFLLKWKKMTGKTS